ncbi:MAG: Stk1 family PASTA domain-containing Ser/Thr kinase, partial [Clostridia bacterium]|nr:Stk1 family PASTA domain-containing Ser/Thr kinase [Clostridia bacterium]
VFDNRYRIDKVIGVGGMAVVFEAYDHVMKRSVAVKMLKDEIAHDTQSVKRFINESKAVAMLSHPNIVKIYDVSVKENRKYIVMERVEGITLKNYLNKKGTLSMREMLQYTEQILLALEHAHSKGVIHRDIKPQNIMLLKNGVIKVTDFGIAKLPNAETVTMSDKAIGTVYYISPEQASGKKVDRRSDIYSLGVLMYEMTTGRLPFIADSPVTVALMHVKDQPKRPSEIVPSIPKCLEQIILAAMEKRPDKRVQSAAQMLRLLDRVKKNPDMVFKTKKEPGEITKLDMSLKKSHTATQQRVSRSMFPIIAGVTCAFAIVAAITMVYLVLQIINKPSEQKSITIDNFVGKTYSEELYKEMLDDYYNVNVEFKNSSEEKNTIIAQSIPAGNSKKVTVNKQDTYINMTITVSKGVRQITLNDYEGQRKEDVSSALRGMGLIVNDSDTKKEYNDEYEAGYVIKTEPGAGQTVSEGDEVVLVVSLGKRHSKITVPKFVGMTRKEAEKALEDYNFKKVTFIEEYHDTVEKDVVIAQSKDVGTELVAEVEVIKITVSKGPDPEKQPDDKNDENKE